MRSGLLRGFAILALTMTGGAVACASAPVRRESCDPVPQELASLGTVYTDCAVDIPAEMKRAPVLDGARLPSATRCSRATLEFVVDTTGRPLPSPILVFKSNEPRFAEAVIAALPSARYSPAVKDKKRVLQYTRRDFYYTMGTSIELVRSSDRASPSRPRAMGIPEC